MSAPLILIVEDEAPIRRFLRAALSAEGYRLTEAETGEQALRLAALQPPDLVILDLGLPDLDGQEVLVRLREWLQAPILILSARGQESQKIAALDGGADDYLTKPFGTGELLARLRVALRHADRAAGGSAEPTLTVGELMIDLSRRQVKRGADEVHLTPIEYKLFATLMKHSGKVLTHRWLLGEVWGPRYADQTQYLRVYMAQLRHKLEAD